MGFSLILRQARADETADTASKHGVDEGGREAFSPCIKTWEARSGFGQALKLRTRRKSSVRPRQASILFAISSDFLEPNVYSVKKHYSTYWVLRKYVGLDTNNLLNDSLPRLITGFS